MSDYTEFHWTADGTVFPDMISEFLQIQLAVRSPSGPANLYVRTTGIAHFDIDPDWESADRWHRGMLGIVTPIAVLQPGDAIMDHCATACFRLVHREEEGPSNIFGIALDEVASVNSSAGNLTMAIKAAYHGDVWVPAVAFAINLLVYRPSLDNFAPHHPFHDWVVFRDSVIYELSKLAALILR